MIDASAVLDAIRSHLQAVASAPRPLGGPRLQAVVLGVPVGPPDVDRAAFLWWDGEADERETLGNIMVTHRFAVALAWLVRPAASLQVAMEAEIFDTVRSVKAALRADSTLGGLVTDLKIGQAVRATGPLSDPAVTTSGSPVYHQVQFDVLVDDYEAEVVTP